MRYVRKWLCEICRGELIFDDETENIHCEHGKALAGKYTCKAVIQAWMLYGVKDGKLDKSFLKDYVME